MEREKRQNHVINECEIIRPRLKRSKNRRRNKCWAQVSSGIILGLLLGFSMELKLFSNRGLQMNETCRSELESDFSSSPYKSQRKRYNEDPLKIIKFEDPTVTTHNSQQSLVFVGVMTAQKYLSTRAVAVYETWGKELPGRIAFFSSEVSEVPERRKDLPLVRLRNVDDSYPPQKKSFMMLQYMWENYGDRFEWFIRADDDVYIRPDKLENFLRSVDSRKPLFIGQAGRGNQEEFGLLSLEYDENFCMGGPGIILSRETLSRVAPHIKHCLKNLYTTHEDVELGRCVKKFADVSCTWSYEMQTILYHNSSGYEAFTGNLKQKEVNRAITLHPVKQHQYMYKIHNYMRNLKIQDLQYEAVLLHRDIKKMFKLLNETAKMSDYKLSEKYPLFPNQIGSNNYLGDTEMIGLEPSLDKYKAKTEKEILHWDFIQRSLYSTTNLNPRRRIETPYREGLEDVVREVMEMINQYSRQRGRVIEYQDLLYGYFRLDPLHGADYILDMLLKYKKYRGRKMTVPVRRHAYLQQQFSGLEIREVFDNEEVKQDKEEELKESVLKILEDNPFKDVIETSISKIKEQFPILNLENQEPKINNKIINFILPLSGRYETFRRFIKNYEEVCLENDERTALVLLLFRNKLDNSANKTMEYMIDLQIRYPESKLKVIPVDDEFARAMALEIGAAYCKDDEYNILFFIDVDMIFTRQTLERIRLNTVRDKQVYFPIVYSEFDPTVVYNNKTITESPSHYLINSDTGYWRQFGFGIVSLFKKELKKVGGFDTSIRGWGKEDVDLYDKFISFSSNITIFRSVDPNLVHVFHIVDCDPNLEPSQLKMCKGTRKDTYGSVNQLAQYIYSNKDIFRLAANKSKKPFS